MKFSKHLDSNIISQVIYWSANHSGNEVIEKKLLEKGLSSKEVCEYLQELAKYKEYQKRMRGTVIILVGVLLLGAGFILTVLFFHQNKSIDMVMYGLTTLGIVVVLWGCKEVFD